MRHIVRIVAATSPTAVTRPSTTLAPSGLSTVMAGQPVTATATFTDNGVQPVQGVRLRLNAPAGWKVTPTSAADFPVVGSGQTVQATFQVVAPPPKSLFQSDTLTATADYRWFGIVPGRIAVPFTVTTSSPVTAPFNTYSSATDGPAGFAEQGTQFAVSGAGKDLFSNSDTYTTIYQQGVVGPASSVQTQVVAHQNLTGFGKAGIMVRNNISGAGTTPEGVILFESPSGGIQLEWSNNGGTFINAVTPANGTIADKVPVWLKLVRAGDTYTGSYSFDGTTWTAVGSATLTAQADTQDAGMFVVSHVSGNPAQAFFNTFTVTAS